MATNTISTYSSTGIQLTTAGAYQSPFTVTSDGTIHATGPTTTLGSDGIYSSLSGASVLNLGTIYGANVGVSLGSGGTVTNAAGVTISGGYVGVAVANAAGDVTNAGTITGAAQFGVYLGLGGSLTNSGIIAGGYYGLVALATATIANTGTISGTAGSGAYIKGGTLTNTGTISGATKSGIFVAGGSVLNTASYSLIAGAKYGLVAEDAAVTVTNSGTIAGGSQEGIFLEGGIITNTASYSLISGSTDGIISEAGSSATIFNAGTITGASVDGVYLGEGGTITNTASYSVISGALYGVFIAGSPGTVINAGTVSGGNDGIKVSSTAVISNSGLITGNSFDGIYLQQGGTVTNATGGTITGNTAVILTSTGDLAEGGSAAQSLDNAGLITATNNGVFLQGSISSVANTGTITGASDALYFIGGGYISNAGTLAGGYAGVHWVDDAGTALTLNNTGSILAGSRGVLADDGGNATIANAKYISGAFMGIEIFNSGISLDTVINTGTITSADFGVFAYTLGNVAVFNSGLITGGATGVQLDNSGTSTNTLVNTGTIADNFAGVYIDVKTSGGAQTVINRGTILAQNGITVLTSASSTTTIENSGTIASSLGASGTAIGTFGADSGPLTLIIDPGAVFIGKVEAAVSAANTLEFGPGIGSLSGIGTQFTNFDTFTVETGGAWTLSAANTLAGAPGIPGPYPEGFGGAGVLLAASAYLSTAGTITGGAGGTGAAGASGGTGADIGTGATLINAGTLAGGAGGYGSANGGNGGVGALLRGGDLLDNKGSIAGGLGGASAKLGGAGGFGVLLASSATLDNAGRVSGGDGESNGATNYSGNTGAYLGAGSWVTNAASGTILGGEGGAGTIGKQGGIALDLSTQFITYSGVVTLISAASLSNFGQIIGGNGGYGNNGGDGGGGGSGIRAGTFATLANHGTIAGGSGANGGNYAGAGGYGLGLDPFATLDNLGLIEGGAGGTGRVSGYGGNGVIVRSNYAVIVNQQNITGGNAGYGLQYSGAGGIGVELQSSSTLINLGTITGGNGGAIAASGIRADPGGAGVFIYGGAGSTVFNAGTISGGTGPSQNGAAVWFNTTASGELILTPTAVFNGAVLGHAGAGDILDLAGTTAPATLTGFGTQFTGFDTLAFGGGTWAAMGNSFAFAAATLDGFAATDTLDVTDFGFVTDEKIKLGSSDTLAIHQGTGTLDLKFTPANTGENFSITSDGAGGVLIEEVTCFLRGTRIATARGQVKVEKLVIGDCVRTVHAGLQPIKWIGTRSYAAPFCNHAKVLPIHIRAHAIAQTVPSRDLFVSPGHAISIDGALIHAGRLVNGVTITQLPRAEEVTYFHIELETHEVILAENCPAETFMGEYFREQFHNAKTYPALYPGAQAPEISVLPFLSHGSQLATILRRLRARAGIFAPKIPGPLRGYIDATTQSTISGWAADLQAPDEPVLLDILAGEKRIARVLANIPRADVRAAGYGAGNHGFEFTLPPGITEHITIRRSADGARLAHPARNRMNGMNRRMGEAPRAAQA